MSRTAFVFDLDGTLIDSVYQHVLSWKDALDGAGIPLPVWKIHRRIGMSGGMFTRQLLRETRRALRDEEIAQLRAAHASAFLARAASIRVLPGAVALLDTLARDRTPWAIATSGRLLTAGPTLALLGVNPQRDVVVTRDQVRHAKPDPDLFLAAAARLDATGPGVVVVGDSVWDMLAARRAGMLPVGLLAGGYGREELERAGALRVFDDPADLLEHLDEIGGRP